MPKPKPILGPRRLDQIKREFEAEQPTTALQDAIVALREQRRDAATLALHALTYMGVSMPEDFLSQ